MLSDIFKPNQWDSRSQASLSHLENSHKDPTYSLSILFWRPRIEFGKSIERETRKETLMTATDCAGLGTVDIEMSQLPLPLPSMDVDTQLL